MRKFESPVLTPQPVAVPEAAKYCPACGRSRDHQLCYIKWAYPILRCAACGLGSTWVQHNILGEELYNADYFSGKKRDGYSDYVGSEVVLRREFRTLIRRMRRAGIGPGKLLEIGCAYGFFLLEAKKEFDVTGIEICNDAVEFCVSRGLNVRQGTISEDALPDGTQYDVTVMLDVIEHLENPEQVLTLIRSRLIPGGALVITTGDWESLLSRVTGQNWRLMTPPQHLYFFAKRNMSLLLERLGFRIVTISYPWKFVPVSLMIFQLIRMLGFRPQPVALPSDLFLPLNFFDTMCVVARKL
jgi:SAM-dependent methyltransferase